MKKNVYRLGTIFLLTLVFLYFFFRKVEWKEVLYNLVDVDFKFFIILILLVPLHFVTRSIRWDFLLKHEKRGIKFSNRFAANAVGFTVTFLFPGRLGEVAKPFYLAQKEKVSRGFALGTIVVERIFDLFTMCCLLGLFMLSRLFFPAYFRAPEEAYSNLQMWGIIGSAIAFLLLVVSFSLYFFRERTLSVLSFLLRPFPEKVSQSIIKASLSFIQGLKFFHSVGDLLAYIMLSFVVWIGIIFFYWIFFLAYNLSVPFYILFPYVFFTMVGASIPTPGMVGGFHYFSKLGLTSFFNIGTNLAVGMTIVIHAVQLMVTCLIGYVILWKEGISLFQLRKIGENTK